MPVGCRRGGRRLATPGVIDRDRGPSAPPQRGARRAGEAAAGAAPPELSRPCRTTALPTKAAGCSAFAEGAGGTVRRAPGVEGGRAGAALCRRDRTRSAAWHILAQRVQVTCRWPPP